MGTQSNLPSFEDIVFEGRNKAYGAFWLRKHYAGHINKALLIAAFSFISLMALPLVRQFLAEEAVKIPYVVPKVPEMLNKKLFDVPKPQVTPKEAANASPAPKPPTKKNLPPVATPSGDEDPPTQQDMKDHASGSDNNNGKGGDASTGNPDGGDNPTGTGPAETTGSDESSNKIFEIPEVHPSPNYDYRKFLKANLRFPAPAQKAEVEGTLYIEMIISETGEIIGVRAVGRTLGFGLEEEAIRVVSKMPPWSPGMQNGKPVKVRMIIPVKFNLQK